MRSSLRKALGSKCSLIIQIILIVIWGTQLINTDAYYVNYALLSVVVGICIYMNIRADDFLFSKSNGKYYDLIIYLSAALFSLMIACSNYRMWAYATIPRDYGEVFKWIYNTLVTMPLFLGGFFAFGHVFYAINSNIKRLFWNKCEKHYSPLIVFGITFVVLVLTRWLVLYFCLYPGNLTPDSMQQMKQVMTARYSNHHPFYHTIMIKFFILLGLKLFGEINAAVATYMFVQILFTAACFSFAVVTMVSMKAPKWAVVISMLFYILMPYHLMYAITMWKDVTFGCFILLLITFLYRCMNSMGNRIFNYTMLVISSLGTCLFRSNGLFAFILLTIVYVAIWRMANKKMLLIFISIIVISFIMKHPVLAGIGVTQPDTIESLSIPAQQIARVVQEGYELDEWETETLSKIVDIDQIPGTYAPFLSDPIKNLVRRSGNQQLIRDQKGDYIKLYLSLGMKYPMVYMRAWIDQTRGYWNAGYDYWRWDPIVDDNDYGIERTTRDITADRVLQEYLWIFANVQVLRVFLSIGTFVWVNLVMFVIALLRRDKVGAFLSAPVIAVLASLVVATPVFAEFRYIYAVFCSLPLVIVIALRPLDNGTKV